MQFTQGPASACRQQSFWRNASAWENLLGAAAAAATVGSSGNCVVTWTVVTCTAHTILMSERVHRAGPFNISVYSNGY